MVPDGSGEGRPERPVPSRRECSTPCAVRVCADNIRGLIGGTAILQDAAETHGAA